MNCPTTGSSSGAKRSNLFARKPVDFAQASHTQRLLRRCAPRNDSPAQHLLRQIFPWAATLCLILAVGGQSLAADPPLLLGRNGIQVSFHSGDAGLARQAAAALEEGVGRIRSKLGIGFDRPVQVLIVRGREEFNRLIGQPMPDWAMAVALPPDAIVVDAVKVTPGAEDNMRLTIIHEATHLALDGLDAGRGGRLPRWFHEGTATWLSGAEHFSADWSGFTLAVAQNALPKLDALEEGFPAGAREANVAYLESESFVRWLVRTRGEEAMRWIVEEYRADRDFHAAFQRAFGEPVEKMESEWRVSMRGSFPWLRALVGSLSFWSVMAAFTILVFLVVRRRRKRQIAEWEREERDWQVAGSDEDGPGESMEDVYDGPVNPDDEEEDF